MQLDGALISIERRSMGGCIDLAIVFVREHLASVLLLTLIFAVPACGLTWWLMSVYQHPATVGLLVFAGVSPFAGAALVAATGRRVFGDEFEIGPALRVVQSRFLLFLGVATLTRLACLVMTLCVLVPGLLPAVRYGFVPEVLFLEKTSWRGCERRISDLVGGVFFDLIVKMTGNLFFFSVLVLGFFVLVDLVSWLLLGVPFLFGRLTESFYVAEELGDFLWEDARCAVLIQALMWLAYPFVRIAWFFCYLDVRIQKEGWDVELDFRIEAQRLSTLT